MPGGRSRAPWAPSPEPLGRLPGGGPDPNYNSERWLGTLGFRIENYVDFDVDFCSFGDRFGLHLGGPFRSLFGLGRPKLVPKPSFTCFNMEKVICHETLRFLFTFL